LSATKSQQQFPSDYLKHAFGVGQRVIVPETDYTIAEAFDCSRARRINLRRMLSSIQFYHQSRCAAGEVGHMDADGELANELGPFNLTTAKVPPQALLRFGLSAPKLARDRSQLVGRQCRSPSPQPSPRRGEGVKRAILPMANRTATTILLFAAGLSLSACVTARLHSEDEVSAVGRECGLELGELFQDKSEKRLLFLFRIEPSAEQRACVTRWARRNHLKTVFIDAINFPET